MVRARGFNAGMGKRGLQKRAEESGVGVEGSGRGATLPRAAVSQVLETTIPAEAGIVGGAWDQNTVSCASCSSGCG